MTKEYLHLAPVCIFSHTCSRQAIMRDLYALEMDAEGFEEEESPLEGLVTGKYGITNSCADVWIWDNFGELALDRSEIDNFSFDFWHVSQQDSCPVS